MVTYNQLTKVDPNELRRLEKQIDSLLISHVDDLFGQSFIEFKVDRVPSALADKICKMYKSEGGFIQVTFHQLADFTTFKFCG